MDKAVSIDGICFTKRDSWGLRVDRQAIWQATQDEFRCEHPATEHRQRAQQNGDVFVKQCTTCGKHLGQVGAKVIPLSSRLSREGVHEFDERLGKQWAARRIAFQNELTERARTLCETERREQVEIRNAEWWDRYNAYLETPEWMERRRLVLERAKGCCEGCRKRAPNHVHHLTYEHVTQEFLFELVALCESCHGRAHPDKDLTSSPRLAFRPS